MSIFDFAAMTMLIFFSELKCRGSNNKKYVKIASLRDLVVVRQPYLEITNLNGLV